MLIIKSRLSSLPDTSDTRDIWAWFSMRHFLLSNVFNSFIKTGAVFSFHGHILLLHRTFLFLNLFNGLDISSLVINFSFTLNWRCPLLDRWRRLPWHSQRIDTFYFVLIDLARKFSKSRLLVFGPQAVSLARSHTLRRLLRRHFEINANGLHRWFLEGTAPRSFISCHGG